MVVGDSLTSAQVWVPELRRRLVGTGGTPAGRALTNVRFIGGTPVSGGSAGEGFFGYGGWTMANWIGASSLVAYWITTTHNKDLTDQKAMYTDANGKRWVLETIEPGRIKVYAYDGQTTLAPSGTLTHSSGGTHTSAITYTAAEAAPATPFWNPAANGGAGGFSIKHWVDTYNGGEAPDIIPVLLGWNGMPSANPPTGTSADHATSRGHLVTFLDKVKAEYPAAKVMLLGLPIPATNGGLGTSYGATGQYADYWRLRRLVSGYNLMLRELSADAAYSAMTTYVEVAAQFDADNNMPGSAAPVNTRNATTMWRSSNGVHPADSGYHQIADAAYRAMARLLV